MTEEKKAGKIIYCDGSSLGNPGSGGWGVLMIDNISKKISELGGGEDMTTNNKMELKALIESLKKILTLNISENIELRLDSEYVIKGATIWTKGWVKNNWIKSDKKPVLNKEYWQEILEILKQIEGKNVKMKWTHVYGHTGEVGNERVDVIAKSFAGKNPVKLKNEF